MKRRSITLLEVLLVLASISEAPWPISGNSDCKQSRSRAFRPHSVTITEFGAVGDGVTLNTKAFQNAIFYLQTFADKGGAQLFVPAGKWLTGSFSLISHLTLLLDKDAVILGSTVCILLECGFDTPQLAVNLRDLYLQQILISESSDSVLEALRFNLYSRNLNSMHAFDVNLGSWDLSELLIGEDSNDWPIVDPLPSYGRGRELPGRRHRSLIYGYNLTDVIITGNNGTIDGRGLVWWNWFRNQTLNFTRPHLVELMYSKGVVISNLTFLNSPFWTIHPVYCSHVHVYDVTILAPLSSPNTDGIDPDSSNDVCIEDCYMSTGDDLISIKSGWDEYGISYGRPSTNIVIRHLSGQTATSAGIALGSEMSGGISEVRVEGLRLFNSKSGIRIKTSPGRGGYIRNIYVSNVVMTNVDVAIRFTSMYGEHPDGNYSPKALPSINRITFKDITGENITLAGMLEGLEGDSFSNICLFNITLNVTSDSPWNCSYVQGYSDLVSPEVCEQIREKLPKGSSACYPSNDLPSQSSGATRMIRSLKKFTSLYPALLW